MMEASGITRMRGHRFLIGCLAVVLFASGCADKDHVPSGILSLSKMQNVMWDMIQADQYATLSIAKDSLAHVDTRAETLKLYEQVFRLHDVSREEFNKSYTYYLHHPDLNQQLFDSLISQGNRLRGESYSRPVAPHVGPIVPPHLPPGVTVPAGGGKPGGFLPGPGVRPVRLLPATGGKPGGSLLPAGGKPGTNRPLPKAQKDSARKHS